MNDSRTRNSHRTAIRHALTLVEMVISIPLVGIALVAALNAVGAAKTTEFKTSIAREGYMLAQDLMSEILLQEYEEPVDTVTFGRESSESGGRRLDYDDVDDYDTWSASPPESKEGTPYVALDNWKRAVTVDWVSPTDPDLIVASDQGVKRIVVKVERDGVRLAKLVALKTRGLPLSEACCFTDGSCADLRPETCATQGGTAQGPDTNCANTECPVGPTVLLVVTDDANPTAQEVFRKDLLKSWGSPVTMISAATSQALFDAAVATADVAYVSESISAIDLGAKLYSAPIGIVNEKGSMMGDFGFTSGALLFTTGTDAVIDDNAHYITSTQSLGSFTLVLNLEDYVYTNTGIATGVQVLGSVGAGKPAFLVADTGAALVGGTPAPDRRVQLFWGYNGFDPSNLTNDGKTILNRAVQWAAHRDVIALGCGDGTCDVGEECACPSDCGPIAAFEEPGVSCTDGLDNDCDGTIDCDDINCGADAACSCGNGSCDPSEDCNSCAVDCPGKTNGKKSSRYCCGNGIVEPPEGDGSICNGNY